MTDFDPVVFGPPTVRVGTAEREQAASALGEHFAAGRLELDEYDDRVRRAYSAKTVGDLSVLFTDLPRPAPAPAPPAESRRPRSLLPVALVAALVIAVVVALTTHIVPFFIFPAILFVLIRGHQRLGFGGGRGARRDRF